MRHKEAKGRWNERKEADDIRKRQINKTEVLISLHTIFNTIRQY